MLHPLGAIAQMRTALHEAETLAEAVDDPQRLGRICRVVCLLSFQTGDYGRGLASGQRALAIGEALGDVRLQFSAHHHLGMNYHMLGDYGRARASLTTAVPSKVWCARSPSVCLAWWPTGPG